MESWENLVLFHNDPEGPDRYLGDLMEIALEGEEGVNWRASWVVDKMNEKYPGVAEPWIRKIIEVLPEIRHHGKKRQFMRILSTYEIPADSFSLVFDYSLERLTDPGEAVAVKAHAMQILYNLCQMEPGLREELVVTLEQEMELRPEPGIISRGRKLTARLRKEISSMKQA